MMASWHFDVCCVVAVFSVPLLYTAGVLRLWRRAGVGRGVRPVDVALFTGGWLAVMASVISPLHLLGRNVFAVHMIEHELLVLVAAPLLVIARPGPVLLWALPAAGRYAMRGVTSGLLGRLWRVLVDPVVATLLHAAAIWLWHMPALFQAALASETVHALQHIAFLGSAALFWWSVLSRESRRRAPGAAALMLFATAIHTTLLGALLTLSRGLWYPDAADPFAICGLTRIEDQQLAGLVMWVPGAVVYLAGLLWLLGLRLMADPVAERSA
jgi:cytochrome c oxidase assembly factor CtaG